MSDPLFWHRLQFGFTATFHYLFPQLTMGLSLLIVVLKTLANGLNDSRYHDATRFWIRVFGINFALGVVTGIPMEFQFGTNWAVFSRISGAVIGQTLAMEGMFAFFLESSFLGILVWGERKFGNRIHTMASWALLFGSWLSGYFIVATDAFMQYPTGYHWAPNMTLQLQNFWGFLLNPWALTQYAHTMIGAVVTGSFVMAAVGAYYMLKGIHCDQAKIYLRTGIIAGFIAAVLVAFPTGDRQGKLVAAHQPVALAAMEGRWHSGTYAEVNFIGQPDVEKGELDNPLRMPGVLSYIAYGSFSSNVKGLSEFPRDQWPTSIELLYYSFHVMVGLGTLFIALMALALVKLWRKSLYTSRPLLWVLMLSFPFPYIANTAGWMTAEIGRQPWLIYGLMRTGDGYSRLVHSGQTVFTLLGFAGLFTLLGCLFLFLMMREVSHGPQNRSTYQHD